MAKLIIPKNMVLITHSLNIDYLSETNIQTENTIRVRQGRNNIKCFCKEIVAVQSVLSSAFIFFSCIRI